LGTVLNAKAALNALQSGDPELTLAIIDTTVTTQTNIGKLVLNIGEKVAQTFENGNWEQKLLGVYAMGAMGIRAITGDIEDWYETMQTRQAQWAMSRQLPDTRETLVSALATMCLRRCADQIKIFEACLAKHGSDLTDFPQLLEEAAVCARRCLENGSKDISHFETFVVHALLHNQQTAARELLDSMSKSWPKLSKLLTQRMENIREQMLERTSANKRYSLNIAGDRYIEDSLGEFTVTSGVLTVGDPGYKTPVHIYRGKRVPYSLHVPLSNVKPGQWLAKVIRIEVPEHGRRCAYLMAHHVSHSCSINDRSWIQKGTIDVEYGIAGVFDHAHYYDESVSTKPTLSHVNGEHPWYEMCLFHAYGQQDEIVEGGGAGIIPFGCVSSSGLGDGSYTCFVVRDDQTTVGVSIDFRLH
jgi:hypothetical protein